MALFQKKRLAERQKLKLAKLESDKNQGNARICFGSKALFKQQHQNDFESHAQWLSAWQAKRSNQFFLVGSKDEISGNQSVVASLNESGSLNLRIRVPDSFSC